MRNYSYKNEWKKLLTPEIVSLLTKIHEYKGEQNNFLGATKDTLTHLVEIAKIQSTESSNKMGKCVFRCSKEIVLLSLVFVYLCE